jgi:hypothetical protein
LLVTTDEQHRDASAYPGEIDAIPGTHMDSHLENSVPDGPTITRIPVRQSINAGYDARSSARVA